MFLAAINYDLFKAYKLRIKAEQVDSIIVNLIKLKSLWHFLYAYLRFRIVPTNKKTYVVVFVYCTAFSALSRHVISQGYRIRESPISINRVSFEMFLLIFTGVYFLLVAAARNTIQGL